MNLLALPWVELTVVTPLVGAAWVALRADQRRAFYGAVAFSGLTLACALMAWVAYAQVGWTHSEPLAAALGRPAFEIDELSAPLLPLVALLYLVTTLATARTKMSRVAFGGLLFSAAVRLGAFATRTPWLLVALLVVGMVPTWIELRARGKPTRVYLLHAGLFVALLVAGQAVAERVDPAVGATLLMLAVLVRSGTAPAHCWVVDLFEHASFAAALLMVAPLTGVYAAVRLVLPIAPDAVLQGISVASLVTAVYAAGMALVQREARRFFAYLFVSMASLVLVGLELHTPVSLTGALCLWISVPLALGGLGLTLRALEARYGRLSLADYHGLYEHSPTLAACFLLTGLASVGFPGTLGFIATELLVDGAVADRPGLGLAVVLASALNGVAILRAYFLLFTGSRHAAVVPLAVTPRERWALVPVMVLLLAGGFFPGPGVESRHRAALTLLRQPAAEMPLPGEPPGR